MTSNHEPLSDALRRMPVPPPRAGFADDALARAIAASERPRSTRSPLGAFTRWEAWMGVAVGAVLAVIATVFVMRPTAPVAATSIALAVDESRNIEVLIDSERTLEAATIRVVTTGAVELEGFDDRHEIEWQTRLERGRNVLSLPVVAHGEGAARLVATIEHEGRSRRVAIQLVVKPRAV